MNRRLVTCTDENKDSLLKYLSQEAELNIFLIADIINYGFNSDIQQVFADYEEDECKAVYIWFCNNLLIYSCEERLQEESIKSVIGMKSIDQVMAKESHLQQIQGLVSGFEIKSKELLALKKSIGVSTPVEEDYRGLCRKAEVCDTESIYDFLQGGELAPMYRSVDMIRNRLSTGDGVHYLVEKDGEIIAQINSAAKTPYSAMIGGLYTLEQKRNSKIASYLVAKLCTELQEEDLTPCLISAAQPSQNLFYKLGFEKVADFTTLEPR